MPPKFQRRGPRKTGPRLPSVLKDEFHEQDEDKARFGVRYNKGSLSRKEQRKQARIQKKQSHKEHYVSHIQERKRKHSDSEDKPAKAQALSTDTDKPTRKLTGAEKGKEATTKGDEASKNGKTAPEKAKPKPRMGFAKGNKFFELLQEQNLIPKSTYVDKDAEKDEKKIRELEKKLGLSDKKAKGKDKYKNFDEGLAC
eukprot:Colp12_sorted_trinity150504_noHs@16469